MRESLVAAVLTLALVVAAPWGAEAAQSRAPGGEAVNLCAQGRALADAGRTAEAVHAYATALASKATFPCARRALLALAALKPPHPPPPPSVCEVGDALKNAGLTSEAKA